MAVVLAVAVAVVVVLAVAVALVVVEVGVDFPARNLKEEMQLDLFSFARMFQIQAVVLILI